MMIKATAEPKELATIIEDLQNALATDGIKAEKCVLKLRALLKIHNTKPTSQTLHHSSGCKGRVNHCTDIDIRHATAGISEYVLLPKDARALAVEVVNHTLKLLTQQASSPKSNLQNESAIRTPLRSINGNAASNATRAAAADKALETTGSADTACLQARQLLECCHIALDYTRHHGHISDAQACDGALLLSSRALQYGSQDIALQELQAIKHSLDRHQSSTGASLKKRPISNHSEERIVKLLQLNLGKTTSEDVLRRAIIYQSIVLKLMSSESQPVDLQRLLSYLQDPSNGPEALILQHLTRTGDKSRAASYLETLSTAILSIVPIAKQDSTSSTGPCNHNAAIVHLQLQSLALRYRKQMRTMTKPKGKHMMLIRGFQLALSTYMQSTVPSSQAGLSYEAVEECFTSISTDEEDETPDAHFAIHCHLYELANRASNRQAMDRWLASLKEETVLLDDGHARTIIAKVLSVSEQLDDKQCIESLNDLAECLSRPLSGSIHDVKTLLSMIEARLSQPLCFGRCQLTSHAYLKLLGATLRTAQRAHRSSPRHMAETLYKLVQLSLSNTAARSMALEHLNQESLAMLIDKGVLKTVVSKAVSMSTKAAWRAGTETVIASQVIKLLTMQLLRSGRQDIDFSAGCDVKSSLERAMLFECYIHRIMDCTRPNRPGPSGHHLLDVLFSKLFRLYDPTSNPVRRMITSIYAASADDLYRRSGDAGRLWQEANSTLDGLAEDQCMSYCRLDVLACYHATMFLRSPASSTCQLEKAIDCWSSMLKSPTTAQQDGFYDKELTMQTLDCIAAYHQSLGLQSRYVELLTVRIRLCRLHTKQADNLYALSEVLSTAQSVCESDCLATVQDMLETSLNGEPVPCAATMSVLVALGNSCIDMCEPNRSKVYLDKIHAMGLQLSMKGASLDQNVRTVQACTAAWLFRSKFCLHTGSVHDALLAAKQALKAANSAWYLLDDSYDDSKPRIDIEEHPEQERRLRQQLRGVQDLVLQHSNHDQPAPLARRCGAPYWRMVSTSCEALLHLSGMHAHLGDFENADVYAQRAISMADAIEGSALSVHARSHRVNLLVHAGKSEDAEALLAMKDVAQLPDCQGMIVYHQAIATIYATNGDQKQALHHMDQAEEIRFRLSDTMAGGLQSLAQWLRPLDEQRLGASRCATKQSLGSKVIQGSRSQPTRHRSDSRTAVVAKEASQVLVKKYSSLSKAMALQRAEILHKLGCLESQDLEHVTGLGMHPRTDLINFDKAYKLVQDCLHQDLRLNAVQEMVMAVPQFEQHAAVASRVDSVKLKHQDTNRKIKSKRDQVPATVQNRHGHKIASLLEAALSHVQIEASGESMLNTSAIYHQRSSYFKAYSCQTALMNGVRSVRNRAITSSFQLEYADMTAATRSKVCLNARSLPAKGSSWPTSVVSCNSQVLQSEFQSHFVDILPKSWTVASLHLDHEQGRLQIARYRAGQIPMVVSLPIVRCNTEIGTEELLDFHSAKAELRDIIERSNKSCDAQGSAKQVTKTDWWRERERLDRQLGLLLKRIQSEWLGGFKGLLSTKHRSLQSICQIRGILDKLTARYWRVTGSSRVLESTEAPPDALLEALATLDSGEDDQAVLDFLYFMQDDLRIKGVDLIDDETDFDVVALELSEALQRLSTPADDAVTADEHLVLILDKQLQTFPWESLPCLETTSTSRVSSMSMLREQLLAMQKQCRTTDGQTQLPYSNGTVILNPSSDLAQTEKALMPSLSALQEITPGWNVVRNKIPSEDEFSHALEHSAVVLYFGHGSGAQYIRPKTVRRLKSCSEVVWLMGCSSGAVQEYGAFDPSSVPLSYLLCQSTDSSPLTEPQNGKKCLAVLANLWDVTDKDIDRFSVAAGAHWGLWPSRAVDPVVKSGRRACPAESKPTTPKMPARQAVKTPRVKQRHQVAADNSDREVLLQMQSTDAGKVTLGEAVTRGRQACYLRYLNGAAPVLYGIPVSLGTS